MNVRIRNFIAVILIALSFGLNAQYYGSHHGMQVGGEEPLIELDSGSVASLKGVKKINIIYDYSGMSVGEFPTEQEYIDKKVREYNEKDPAKAEKFKESWYASRKERFEPKFEELFSKTIIKTAISAQNYSTDGEVTLKVQTRKTEPGFHAGVVKKPAYIDVVCTFSDKNGNNFVRYIIQNATGTQYMGFDYDAGTRLSESYAKSAKMLAKDVTKRLKKLD